MAAKPKTLAIDVGGSHIKAAVVDTAGRLVTDRTRVPTPKRFEPSRLVQLLVSIARQHRGFSRVSVGVNGLVADEKVLSLPASGSAAFRGFDLRAALRERVHRPVRVLNDAEMHGLGAIRGRGVELVITLGTGLGTALFVDGKRGLDLCVVPAPRRKERKGGDYGDIARKQLGRKAWSQRVVRLVGLLRTVTNFEHLYIGGGNSRQVLIDLGDDMSLVDNHAALIGAARAWD